MSLWRWSGVMLVALFGCAADLPQPPVTTPAATTRPLAWVLWEEERAPGLAPTWRLFEAFERRDACHEYLSVAVDVAASMPEARQRVGPTVVHQTPYGESRLRYVCLPDTMDPRR
jgi:hypothetical protein